MLSGLSDKAFILFDSCTKTNRFLLGKMLETLGGVTSFFLFFLFLHPLPPSSGI